MQIIAGERQSKASEYTNFDLNFLTKLPSRTKNFYPSLLDKFWDFSITHYKNKELRMSGDEVPNMWGGADLNSK